MPSACRRRAVPDWLGKNFCDLVGFRAFDHVAPPLFRSEQIYPACELQGEEKFAKAHGVREPCSERSQGTPLFGVDVMQKFEAFEPFGVVQTDDCCELVSEAERQTSGQKQNIPDKVPTEYPAITGGVEALEPLIDCCPDQEDQRGAQGCGMHPCRKTHQAFAEENLLPVCDREYSQDHAHKKSIGYRPSDACAKQTEQGCEYSVAIM